MQTLTAGSFLNLENAEAVEALKFTARRLAEHTANVVKENLSPVSLKNLANSLWEKAEYVARNRAATASSNFRRELRRAVPRVEAPSPRSAEFGL